MNKTKKTLNFHIGGSFGQIITQIAQEKTLKTGKVEDGIKVLQDSLQGIDEKHAFEVLVGYSILVADEETQEVKFQRLNKENMLYSYKYLYRKIDKAVNGLRALEHYLRENLRKAADVTVTLDNEILMEIINEKDYSKVIDSLDYELSDYTSFIYTVADTMKLFMKDIQLMESLTSYSAKYPYITFKGYFHDRDEIFEKVNEINGLLSNGLKYRKKSKSAAMVDLDRYLASQKEITKTAKEGIKPADPKDKWDAGWIAQDGTYYALNGEIANMLHNQLEDMMLEAGIIPEDFGGEINGAVWLERNGWAKQHGNHILYEGYNNSKYSDKLKDIPISKKQIEVITLICRMHHTGIIWPGINPANKMSVLMWAMSDPLQHRLKWFAY